MRLNLAVFALFFVVSFASSSFAGDAGQDRFGSQLAEVTPERVEKLRSLKQSLLRWAYLRDGAVAENPEGVQGDIVEISGMLCLLGMEERCLDVKRSQGADGRFWRNPGQVGQEQENTFSRDHFKGVMEYLIATKDREVARKFYEYAKTNDWKMCKIRKGNRCSMYPGSRGLFAKVMRHIGMDVPRDLSKHEWVAPISEWISGRFARPGFESILNVYDVLIHRALGTISKQDVKIAKIAYRRNPYNPMAKLMVEGPSNAAADLILEACPSDEPQGYPYRDMLWNRVIERETATGQLVLVRDWGNDRGPNYTRLNSNGWDCVLAIQTFLSPIDRVGVPLQTLR